MTVITSKPLAAVSNAKAFAFKGRNAVVRNAALAGIASLAYSEGQSRTDVINQLRLALGNKPSADELSAAQREYVAGRIAQRMAASDFPRKDMSIADRIVFARLLDTAYAAPVKDGVKARALRKGQVGRRSISQHRAVRAAEETWSLVKAELGFGTARTQEEKNAKTRAPSMAGSGKGKKGAKSGAPTHSELVKPDGPMTRTAACEYLAAMAKTMAAFAKKHAALIPTDHGTAVNAFASAIGKAEALRKSVATV